MRSVTKAVVGAALALGVGATLVAACNGPGQKAGEQPGATGPQSSLQELMKARNLNEADVTAALKTYTPTGKRDDYYMFASGGHSGQVVVIGIPSMRILKYIGVFTPEPWQGYGYGDESDKFFKKEGVRHGTELTWGDTHHPALSETKGDYDGQYLFINDKANPRVAVINLKDFITTQIVSNPFMESSHGSAVTPNTEYLIEGSQYAAPLGGTYADVSEYNEKYRGMATFWKFDREKGRIDPDKSFSIELPPYAQDLVDAGKLDSDGWAFINSFNTERSYGGNAEGRPALESGASQNDMDYLHVINWKKAEQVAAEKGEVVNGQKLIRLKTAIDEGLLYFVPEPKSPHGVDVTPDGKALVVSGKLDTHTTVYDFAKMKALIEAKKFDGHDAYGVPILPFKEAIRGQCEVGLGPLHTQFDNQGNAYTSLFLESKVAKWSVADLKVLDKISVHYNVGHISAAEGDTVSPDGKWLMSMNKWALDRFDDVGPLLPQNFQLIDISNPKMQLVYDLPIPLGEPHYAQMIKADKVHPIDVYKPAGENPYTQAKDKYAVEGGKERVERNGKDVHVYMTAIRSHFVPDTIRLKEGDNVHLHITNIEQAKDATHGFALDSFNVNLSLEPGEHANVDFVANKAGVFPMYCTEFCSALHLEMAGYVLVEPAEGKK